MKETREIVSAQFFDNYHIFFSFGLSNPRCCINVRVWSKYPDALLQYFQFDTIYPIVQTCSS